MMPDPAVWPALIVAALGAILDVRHRRIPNWLCTLLALCAGASVVIATGAAILPWALLHAVIALLLGMLLFSVRVIGGGDAKFYAAAACGVPAWPLTGPLALLGWTSAAGLVLLIVMMVGRRIVAKPENGSLLKGWSVPYGVAIAAGFWLSAFTG